MARRKVGACVMGLGFDVALDDEAGCRRAIDAARRVTDSVSVPLIPVRTNFRRVIPVNWELCFADAALACLSQTKGRFSTGLFASGEPYDKVVQNSILELGPVARRALASVKRLSPLSMRT